MPASATESLPFDIGSTYYGPTETIDLNNLRGGWLEGKEVVVPDKHGRSSERTGFMRKLRIMRNLSGVNLVPKKVIRVSAVALSYHGRTDGYTNVVAQRGFAVDEFLPAAGVRNGDLFYAVVEGPCVVKTPTADNAGIAINDPVTTAVGTSATNADAGYVDKSSYAGATTALAAQIQNRLGFALEARLAAEHTTDFLIYMMPH